MSPAELKGGAEMISVIVPVVERHGDLRQLHDEFAEALARLGRRFEFIFVVDSGLSGVLGTLEEIEREADHDLVVVLQGGNFGESAALSNGFERARGEILMTVAAYFQVDPQGIVAALAALERGAELVVGRRFPRIDSAFNRLQSRLFHSLLSRMTSTRFHDISCGFRLLRRRVAEELNIYGGLHRFIPILATNRGFRVEEIDIRQRSEDRKTRYYGTGVYLGRSLDILTVFFLMKFTRQPLRFFGLLGLGLFVAGLFINLYLVASKLMGGAIYDRPLLLLGVLLMVFGVQILSLGLVGEIIIFTHARNIREYQVGRIVDAEGSRRSGPGRDESGRRKIAGGTAQAS